MPEQTLHEQTLSIGVANWFYREAQPVSPNGRPPVLLLHGLVSQSYGWRHVLPALAEQGFRAIAPDWVGHGKSNYPDRREFAYTAAAYETALGEFVDALGLERFSLVVQGFLGSVGLQYALAHPERIERVMILNAPIVAGAKLPFKLRQMTWPLVGDMMTQDPLLVDRTLEGGGGYRVEDADLDVYRRPFLTTSAAGRSLMATIQGLQLDQTAAAIAAGFATWERPVLVAWGIRDPWLPTEQAQGFVQGCPGATLTELEGAGHYPQEDWHEKVNEALIPFLRAMTV